MKSYNQFVSEAYSARENLHEFLGLGRLALKGLTKIGSKGFQFGQYAGRRGIGAASAGYALAKGDPVGTGLGLASMLPGAPGLLALGAQAVRSLRGDYRNNQPKQDEKEKEIVTPSQSDDNTTQQTPPPEKSKSVEDISKGIDDTIKQIEKSREKWKTNPPQQTQPPKLQEPKQEKKKRTIKDIRDRDINARGSYDPRYDR